MSLDRNVKFETGRKLVKLSQSLLHFLSKGDSIAMFKSSGISPRDKDKFIIL